MYIHTCIHMYVRTCMHAYIHIYIHTYIHINKVKKKVSNSARKYVYIHTTYMITSFIYLYLFIYLLMYKDEDKHFLSKILQIYKFKLL